MQKFSPRNDIDIQIIHNNENNDSIKVSHTYNQNQINWFKAGSSLNLISNAL